MGKYYDGTKLLSMLDIDGHKPEIYMCTTNRTGGKTTYFSRLLVNRFLKQNKKFALFYRYGYELKDVADKFFKDIGTLFFFGYSMTAMRRADGKYYELFLHYPSDAPDFEGWSCGYAIALNASEPLKKYSHMFSDVDAILFDEFQSESNMYCANEVGKFISLHTSIARGQGEQVRYVPVYMLSNPVSIINPYYVEMGISSRIQKNTHFLRGHGFVLENGFVESASKAQKESGFNRAFSSNRYVEYANECIYLNDNKAFIEKPTGRSTYLATIVYENKSYAIREFSESGILYCDDKTDESFKFKIAVTTTDHQVNYIMLKTNDGFIMNMRFYFERGCFRFKNLLCKEALLKLISY